MSNGVPDFHAIAEALGEGWSVADVVTAYEQAPAQLDGPNGAGLHLRHGGWRNEGRIRIRGELHPAYKPHLAPKFEISVADTKSAATIARDITRRILDAGYWEVLAVTLERKRDAEEAERRRAELFSVLLEVLNGQAFGYSNRIRIGGGPDSEIWGDVDVWSDDVKFKLHIPVAQAQRFASMVADLMQESTGSAD
jgi:hypothetical protein